jgi:hypothetical protein
MSLPLITEIANITIKEKDNINNTKYIYSLDALDNIRGNSFIGTSGAQNDRELNNRVNSIETIRNIINYNRFDLLENIYKKIFEVDTITDNRIDDSNYKCYKETGAVLAPFEGYYINENIMGLLSSIQNNLFLPNTISEQEEIYKKERNKINIVNNSKNNDRNLSELICQTYFFRQLAREDNLESRIFDRDFEHLEQNFYDHWLTGTYDYNKTYNKSKPPINTILQPYFEVINNIYLFYVVSNTNFKKCDKQIKLIADSKEFLNTLNMYIKEKETKLTQLKNNQIDDIFLSQDNTEYPGYKNSDFVKFTELKK